MSTSLQKVIDTLIDRRQELQAKTAEIANEVSQIETALQALGQLAPAKPRSGFSEVGRQNMAEAQRRRHAVRQALGLPYMATNAEVEAALASQPHVEPRDLAIAG